MTDTVEEPLQDEELDDPNLFFNRELSWLAFNGRVLELGEDGGVPLLERLKFCAIWASNLDEFFMVRVAGLHHKVDAGIEEPGSAAAGMRPMDNLVAIHEEVHRQSERVSRTLRQEIFPALADRGIRIICPDEVPAGERERLQERFRRQIFPVLTPLAVGMGRPFPYISNLSLSLGVLVRDPSNGQQAFARVKVPKEVLPRFLPLGDRQTFVPLEDLIAANLDQLFPGMEVVGHDVFRVTRDADFEVSDEADDLLQAVEEELRRRRFGEVVRLELGDEIGDGVQARLEEALAIEDAGVFGTETLLDLRDLMQIMKVPGHHDLRDRPWTPRTQPRLQATSGDDGPVDVFAAMRKGDLLVHHPYDSFHTSVEAFVEQAVSDPDVLAIKQTVYRTSDDTPLVPGLIRASEQGKQAVCLVELKARFDERANIQWARALEEAGVHVVYGGAAVKVHAKCVLVVRREGEGVRHYVHVGTGNYHPKTSRLYTDFGLFTCDPEVAADVADMFNQLTGFARPRSYRRVLVAPTTMRKGIIARIDETIAAHERGEHARIRLKMNSLVDGPCIKALHRASQAGVTVEVNVRGICTLRPGIPGVSDGIRVVSVVGRFLEHSRIFSFEQGEEHEILIGSADLMPRNLDTRVELDVPIRDPDLRADLADTLERCFADDTNAWELQSDGSWIRRTPDPAQPRMLHRELMRAHAARAQAAADAS